VGGGVDQARFRQVLGHFPSGVTVISAIDDGLPVGVAVGAFFSVSLEPPLVGICVGQGSSTWPSIRRAGAFCVNVLADDQEGLSRRFSVPADDRFDGLDWEPAPSGSPRLPDALAWIDCRVHEVHPAGDHVLCLGRVLDLGVQREGGPLVFFRGGYGHLAP
jgi:3-hydroxy-9,10-secoandrosta-1,3,5(10)-triene-9,17-dione monooxygenase reductase component